MTGLILVVDDVATNRVVLRAKLSAAYYEVAQAENGHDALKKARSLQPDLILLDVLMPGLDGYAVCDKIKHHPDTAHIPVIMVTSLHGQRDRLRGLEAGADDFLSKPINDVALFARVRNLLRTKQMEDELKLRDITRQSMGLAEAQGDNDFQTNAQVMLLPPTERTGDRWSADLTRSLPVFCTVSTSYAADRPAHAPPPDAFVIHSHLPGFTDGLRAVSHVRANSVTRHAAVLLVVPEAEQEKAAKGLDLGANDYILEPFDPHELTVRLRSQLRRKSYSDQLRDNVRNGLRQAAVDPLTELYNRRYAAHHLHRIAERSRVSGKAFAVMMVDIDKFKDVNDRFGHTSGDQVLKEFARRLLENLRGIDLVARVGGEEFLIAMPDTSKQRAEVAAERLRAIIADQAFTIGDDTAIALTASFGVTLGLPNAGAPPDGLLSQADQALYDSKAGGRNLVTFFQSAA